MSEKKPRWTPKQQAFPAAVAKHKGNLTAAAMEVYDVKDRVTAAQIGSQNIRKLHIREEVEKAMAEVGLDLKDALWAVKDAYGATDKDGRKDHRARLTAANLHAKLADLFPVRQSTQLRGNVNLTRVMEQLAQVGYDKLEADKLQKAKRIQQQEAESVPTNPTDSETLSD